MRAPRAQFAGVALAAFCLTALAADLPGHFAALQQAEVSVVTTRGTHRFTVWIASDELSRERGLMNVHALAADRGMLFLFERPRFASFWMKDTYISLDLVFIDTRGVVANIASNAEPLSLDPIESVAPVGSVLELPAGTAARIGLRPGDTVTSTSRASPEAR
jgi:uncharacterized membrane protein (UPF0127 family)